MTSGRSRYLSRRPARNRPASLRSRKRRSGMICALFVERARSPVDSRSYPFQGGQTTVTRRDLHGARLLVTGNGERQWALWPAFQLRPQAARHAIAPAPGGAMSASRLPKPHAGGAAAVSQARCTGLLRTFCPSGYPLGTLLTALPPGRTLTSSGQLVLRGCHRGSDKAAQPSAARRAVFADPSRPPRPAPLHFGSCEAA